MLMLMFSMPNLIVTCQYVHLMIKQISVTSKNVFSSVFHSFSSHSIIKHILFAFHPSLESVVINYLFGLSNLGIVKSVKLLLLLLFLLLLSCEKSFAKFSQKSLVVLISNFD